MGIPSSLSKSAGFVSLAGKTSLVSLSGTILFLSMFIYRWGSNFVERKLWLKRNRTAEMLSVPPTKLCVTFYEG